MKGCDAVVGSGPRVVAMEDGGGQPYSRHVASVRDETLRDDLQDGGVWITV